MAGRKRVLDALNHREPERIPLDIGGTFQTGISKVAMERVLPMLGLGGEPVDVVCVDQQLADPTEPFARAVGSDVRGVCLNTSSYSPVRTWETEEYLSYEDGWGIQDAVSVHQLPILEPVYIIINRDADTCQLPSESALFIGDARR